MSALPTWEDDPAASFSLQLCFLAKQRIPVAPTCRKSNIYDSMAEGVQGAYCLVAFMTAEYERSKNCRLECQFAQQSGVPIVPVLAVKRPRFPMSPLPLFFDRFSRLRGNRGSPRRPPTKPRAGWGLSPPARCGHRCLSRATSIPTWACLRVRSLSAQRMKMTRMLMTASWRSPALDPAGS